VRLRTAGRNDMATDESDYGFTAENPLGRVRTTFSYPMYLHFREANRPWSTWRDRSLSG
jgi:hypothetical protein